MSAKDRDVWQRELVSDVLSYTNRNDSSARQALAVLRRAARGDWEGVVQAYPFVVQHVPEGHGAEQRIDDAVLVASLIALHRDEGGGEPMPLGTALAQVMRDTKSPSVELRFMSLLSARREDLDSHLRNAISLCAAKGQRVDWYRLLRHLQAWSAGGWAQKEMARDFWTPRRPADAADAVS